MDPIVSRAYWLNNSDSRTDKLPQSPLERSLDNYHFEVLRVNELQLVEFVNVQAANWRLA